MKSIHEIQKIVAQFHVRPRPEMRSKILNEALEIQRNKNDQNISVAKLNIWKTIMKSPTVKLATVAVIIIACVVSLSLWRNTGSGIALADVLTRIEQVTAYAYQIHSTVTDLDQEGSESYTATILISEEVGLKMTITQVDSNDFKTPPHWRNYKVGDEWYLLPQSRSVVVIIHKKKIYFRFVFDDPAYTLYKEQYSEPREIIKQILSCEHGSLGQSVIDGVTVEGFQTTDLAYGGGFFGHADTVDTKDRHREVDVKLWVDVNTFLPVRLEEDIITSKGLRIHDVSYDFRWNVIVNSDDFEPNIPEDYRAPVGDVIEPAFDEENAIKGLKLFADSFEKFPADIKRSNEEYSIKTGLDPNSIKETFKDLSDEERTRLMSELLISGVPAKFYDMQVEEERDPAYYGQTVRPGDSSKVLLRWKLDDGRYRAIFGDLSVKTVTPEELTDHEN